MDECDSGQTNTTHLWGFLLQRKSIQKRFPRQEKTSRKCENVDRLSPQGGDLVQNLLLRKMDTVEGDGAPTIETYLHGFSGNLYDSDISVTLKTFLRPQRKFESLDALKAQLKIDADFT